MGVVIAGKLARLDWSGIAQLLPADPAFWLAFAAFYLINPVGDWMIFRRLWRVGPSGFFALMRKQVYNELVLGYLGEAHFYAWAKRHIGARQHAGASVFGVVKDVALLSALAGNLFTIILMVVMWPQLSEVLSGGGLGDVLLSLGVVLGLSAVVLALRGKVFSLGLRTNAITFAVHFARTILKTGLGALIWHLMLPEVALGWWLVAATLRQMVMRLPLVSNKDLLFAGLAVLTLGDQPQIAGTMALTAALLMVTHVIVGVALLRGEVGEVWRLVRGQQPS